MALKRLQNKEELFKFKNDRCTIWREENIVPAIGMRFKIHSPFTDTYYETEVREDTCWEDLDGYIKQGNVYVEIGE